MKKISLIFLFLTLGLLSFSQIRMGITGGTQVAWLSSDDDAIKNNGAVMGFHFGLLADYFFAKRYSFSTGVFINNTGGNLKYADTISFKTQNESLHLEKNSNIRYRLQYLDIPMSFHLESNQIGYFVYHAQFGLTNHIRLGAKANIDTKENKKIGSKEEIAFYNLSYNIGIGTDYYLSKNTALTLSLIFSSSFIDLTKNTKDKTQINSLSLRLGVIF